MKKKLLMLCIMQIISFCTFAQSSQTEFFKEGKVWLGRTCVYGGLPVIDFSVQVCGDTVINDIKCKKMTRIRYKPDTHEVMKIAPFVGYEKDGKIFIGYGDEKSPTFYEHVNFNLPIGFKAESFEIIGIDTIEVNGIKRKRLTSKRGDEYIAYIVEGIGYNDTAHRYFISNSYYDEILSVYEDGKCIFTKEDYAVKPISGIANVSDTDSSEYHAIYNLLGEKVDVPIKGHIYIRNHKKFVAK